MNEDKASPDWVGQFQIESHTDLDFVIAQDYSPIGMTRASPPEFRRRALAAAISYQLQLRSIDYALKRYVDPKEYEDDDPSIGYIVSDFLKDSANQLRSQLRAVHHVKNFSLGQFESELTLFKFLDIIGIARMLANRGLFLEVLPILRLCLEMVSWAAVVFHFVDDTKVKRVKAQHCIPKIKSIYESVGKIYGYLSRLLHWEQIIHSQFLNFDEEHVSVIRASCQHRAMSLTLCLLVLDVFVEVIRSLYLTNGKYIIIGVQGTCDRSKGRKIHQLVSDIADFSESDSFRELHSLLR